MPAPAAEPPSLTVRPGLRVAGRAEVASFAATLQSRLAKGRSFHCLISDDAELRRLNRRFRGKNKATDVLSFPAAESGPERHLGDIAISLDHARIQARERGHAIADELRILMLHGLLHLLGMDHESDSGEMARSEIRWRRKFALPLGLIERVAQ